MAQWTDGQVMKGASHRPHIGFQCVIVLFGPTLAAMCKQCALFRKLTKQAKQRSLFESGELAVTSLCHSRASRLRVWLYKRETSRVACS